MSVLNLNPYLYYIKGSIMYYSLQVLDGVHVLGAKRFLNDRRIRAHRRQNIVLHGDHRGRMVRHRVHSEVSKVLNCYTFACRALLSVVHEEGLFGLLCVIKTTRFVCVISRFRT